jgi:type IV pilus assembly protein PilY1
MNKPHRWKFLNLTLKWTLALSALSVNFAVNAVIWPATPAGSTISATPMTMLVASKDHKMFYEAYNDASDVDGDGTLDTRFKPSITYYGLFDSSYCYDYSTTDNRFYAAGTAGTLGVCSSASAQWSGNWLNYMTTTRIDALRKVLYGGHREIDTKAATVLRRAYVPQDAHSWGKEFTSETVDGYKISDYTSLAEPATSTRHFFGNLTANRNTNCSTLSNCSDALNPLLRIRTDVGSGKRIWEWASKERPVLHNTLSSGGFPAGTGAEQNFAIRVLVCTPGFRNGCKAYTDSSSVTTYKPVGLLHEYGESNAMFFGLLSGSYDDNMAGGRLRKTVGSFANEVDAATGIFKAYLSGGSATDSRIVTTFDRLRIRGFNDGGTSQSYRGGWVSNRAMSTSEFVDWGNPVSEMLYEATRYFAGKTGSTAAFNSATARDTDVGLSTDTWEDPYSATSSAKAPYCARASFLTISDVNPSFDSDQIPGHYSFTSLGTATFAGDLTGLNVETLGDTITGVESNITGMRFIGESGATVDSAPTPKNVTSLGRIRGLAPEEPTRQGSYYSASMAFYAKTADLRGDLKGKQNIDNYVVALSSPLPKIEVPFGSGTATKVITLVPFAKTVRDGGNISAAKGQFQPTDQIVDFYVERIANSGTSDADASVNGGRYYAEFQINFEDVEQGADHDMDVIAKYIVQKTAAGSLSVTVIPTYQAGGMVQNMGYVISGTTQDGVYLVATDETGGPAYYLNVPPGQTAGFCDATPMPASCNTLPALGGTATFTFTAGASGAATLLKDPLWYAAKYGGFIDRNSSGTPDKTLEWDADSNGVPDTYFLVQNPLKLRDSLKKAFDTIIERNGSGGNVIANSTVLSTDALVYQATFNSSRWSGDLEAYRATSAGVSKNVYWKASEKVPAASSRNIRYMSDAGTGKSFESSNLSTTETTALGSSSTYVLGYIRGEREQEIQNGGTFRNRPASPAANVLGDIAHSSPYYVKDTNTVYVGANDGMLHAFNSETGVEQFAFIPSTMLPRLKNLTSPAYNDSHEYFVDGDIAVSSKAQTTDNHLVATLGRGGKGLFGLKVSNPDSFANSDVLWEYMSTTDRDLGHMLGRPVIAKMKNDEWAVIVGNGYNSIDGKAVLYIINLKTGALMRKIDTGVAGDNGLATPGVVLDTDGKAQTVYSGDLKGNVWKFDVSGSTTSTWVVSHSVVVGTTTVAAPFFTAKYGSGTATVVQPITAPITTVVNDVTGDPNFGKRFVYFGTGSDFQAGDSTSDVTQTWYGLIDESMVIINRANLVSREVTTTGNLTVTVTVTALDGSTSTTFELRPVRVFGTATTGDMTSKSGFFLDLPGTGERIVTASNYFKLAEPVLLASSLIPTADACEPGGRGYLNAINAFTGARLTKPFFDVDDDGSFTDDVFSGAYVGSVDLGVGKPGEAILIGNRLAVGGSQGIIEDIRVNRGITPVRGRLSWREIVRD